MENGEGWGGGGQKAYFFDTFLLVVYKQDCIPKISLLSLLEVPKQSLLWRWLRRRGYFVPSHYRVKPNWNLCWFWLWQLQTEKLKRKIEKSIDYVWLLRDPSNLNSMINVWFVFSTSDLAEIWPEKYKVHFWEALFWGILSSAWGLKGYYYLYLLIY